MVTILLVDDEELNVDMLKRRLERRAFTVIVACNGEEAIQRAETDQPDLILMDVKMPILDGLEATQRLKASEKTRAIPIIALSSYAYNSDREQALAVGADEYETKPVDFPRLLDKIQVQLDKRAGT